MKTDGLVYSSNSKSQPTVPSTLCHSAKGSWMYSFRMFSRL